MQHVEFLGLPGSAKTTVAKAVTDSLPGAIGLEDAVVMALREGADDEFTRLLSRVVRSGSNPLWKWAYARSSDRFAALARFISEHPRLLQRVTKTQRRRSDHDRYQGLVLNWLLNLMARFQLVTEHPPDREFLVIDEGFCQRAVALFAYGFHDDEVERLVGYLEDIPRPDTVIVVDTPLEVCEARLETRGWSERVVDLDGDNRRRFLQTSAAVIDIVETWLENAGVTLVRVDGTSPARDLASELTTTLSR